MSTSKTSSAKSATSDATSVPEKPAKTVFAEPVQFDLTSYPCPRCQTTMAAESYGPCQNCVDELKASQQSEATGEVAAAYEPKMNVTPNAVALKDD
jgi:hypothetical protein